MSKPEQVSRPAKPALPAAGETSAAAADTAERLSKLAGYSRKIPRLVSPKICVDTTLIIGFTYVVCKHDEIIGRVNADM